MIRSRLWCCQILATILRKPRQKAGIALFSRVLAEKTQLPSDRHLFMTTYFHETRSWHTLMGNKNTEYYFVKEERIHIYDRYACIIYIYHVYLSYICIYHIYLLCMCIYMCACTYIHIYSYIWIYIWDFFLNKLMSEPTYFYG